MVVRLEDQDQSSMGFSEDPETYVIKAHGALTEQGEKIRSEQMTKKSNMFSKEQHNRKFQMLLREKEEQLESISALCHKYDMSRIKNKMIAKIQTKLKEVSENTIPETKAENDAEDFLQVCLEEHMKSVGAEREDALEMALKIYKSHLNLVISRDIEGLKTKREKLAKMLENLTEDEKTEGSERKVAIQELEKLDGRETKSWKVNEQKEHCAFIQKEIADLAAVYTRQQLASLGLLGNEAEELGNARVRRGSQKPESENDEAVAQ